MRGGRLGVGLTVAVLGASLTSTPAPASEPSPACFDAYVQGQRLRKQGKLREADVQLLACAQRGCPTAIQSDCAHWAAEIERDLPTVIFMAKDERGQDLTDVLVFVDDDKIADHVDGRATPLDPGPHKVRFETSSRKIEQRVVVVAGDTNRRIEGDFAAAEPAPSASPAQAPPATPAAAPEDRPRRRIPVVSIVLGAVAGVGAVSFVSFAVAGRSEQSCAPRCSTGQVDALRRDYAIADVSWITGLAALGGAVYFWLAQPRSVRVAPSTSGSAASLRIVAEPRPGGGSLGLRGSF